VIIIIYYFLRHCELHVPVWLIGDAISIVKFTGMCFYAISVSNKVRLTMNISGTRVMQLSVTVFPNVLGNQMSKKRRIQDEGRT